jgi:YggT family protein
MNPFAQLIDILVGLYITVILIRFFLQYFRADFYNPLSQFVVKATDPLIKPLRKIIPGFAGIDMSSLVLAYLITLAKFMLILMLTGQLSFNVVFLLLYSVIDLLQSILGLFMFLILIRVIMSWVSPGGYNPVMAVIGQISEPIVGKFRKLLPPMGGFDFAPMLALILLFFVNNSITYWLVPILYRLA